MQLKDSKLFRQQAYIDGIWVEADSRKTFNVNNPADDSTLGPVPIWARPASTNISR